MQGQLHALLMFVSLPHLPRALLAAGTAALTITGRRASAADLLAVPRVVVGAPLPLPFPMSLRIWSRFFQCVLT